MAELLRRLPLPRNNNPVQSTDPSLGAFSINQNAASTTLAVPNTIPCYGNRQGWFPRRISDFGKGGAFPEIPIAQFPLDMGRAPSNSNQIVPLQIGPDGKVEYDAIVKQGTQKVVFSKPEDQKAKHSSGDKFQKPGKDVEEETLKATREALNLALEKRLSVSQPVKEVKKAPEFFRYTPNQQAPGHNSNCAQRVIRMVDKQKDLLEPSAFRHKRMPAGPPSPPPPVQHSPPRKLTLKDQQEWKIPPSVSNWKNQKGYTIPLDKRVQADGRGLQEVCVNDKFASFSETLYIAERSAREEIRLRNEMIKQKKAREEEVREQQLRELAVKARAERSSLLHQKHLSTDDTEGRKEREIIEKERKREIERDLRLEKSGKRTKRARDADRDISERIALGQAQATSQESLFDARLFNQTSGLDTGYAAGEDEQYSLYDKPLFADRSVAGIYQHSRERFQQSVGETEAVPAFSGADKNAPARSAPVEFEQDTSDPFGLESLLSEARKK